MVGKKQRQKPRLAVLETAEWYDNDRITSIKPLLQIIMQHLTNDPSHFLYSTFVNKKSFNETLKHFAAGKPVRGVQYIHIACHGKEGKLCPGNKGETISTGSIPNRLDKKSLRGIFLSVCQSNKIAYQIADETGTTGLWTAGYSEDVDWFTSCAFEMLFWRMVLIGSNLEAERLKKKKTTYSTKDEKIINIIVTVDLLHDAGYGEVMKRLGFHIYAKDGKNTMDIMEIVKLAREDRSDN